MMRRRLTVRVALGASGARLSPARWTIDAGRTAALGPAPAGSDALDALLLPGLVNAHAHLDLAGGAAVPAASGFTAWLLGVGSARGEAREIEAAAESESAALGRRGVTAIGDVDASGGRATLGRRRGGVAGISYLEIVGVAAASARARLAEALELADRLGGPALAGLSPHAPYSVAAEVLPEIVRAARRRGLRLAMHLAETPEETRYLLRGDGPFEDFLKTIGRGRPFERVPGLRPLAYAEAQGLLEAGCVVIHGNDLDEDDVARLRRHRCSVVYCHGTHGHFGRPPHRLPELLAAGVNVALGTDSGLSNRGVDLLGELRRLSADRPEIPPLALLRCATAGGRIALGADAGAADFAPGTAADGVLLAPAPPDAERMSAEDLAAWALSDAGSPALTLHAGRPLAGEGAGAPALAARVDTMTAQG